MIIGILATLLMPNYRGSVMRAQGADVATRVEAINLAIKEYEADHDTIPTGTGPVGSPPAWLTPYLTKNHFAGPAGVTWQYAKASTTEPPTLLIAAGAGNEAPILLSAAAALQTRASVISGGMSLLVTLE